MIGITGVATSGKDTLQILLNKFFKEKGLNTKRYALADFLKKDIKLFVKEKFNIDLENISPDEKELIRPLMVSYGKIKRNQTNGRYWIDNLNTQITRSNQNNEIVIITDIRYNEFERDELFWLKEENNGFLIHISRVYNGKIIPPANEEESKNDRTLQKSANYQLVWCTESNIDTLYNEYKKNIEEIYEAYRRHRTN